MQILKEIKLGRLVLAIAVTVLVSDTVPHPNLSAGLLENSLGQRSAAAVAAESSKTAIAESGR
ncbi:MAG: hypothetical protein ACFB0G_24060 [Leptolyngbyaceae cyanobacterium]